MKLFKWFRLPRGLDKTADEFLNVMGSLNTGHEKELHCSPAEHCSDCQSLVKIAKPIPDESVLFSKLR